MKATELKSLGQILRDFLNNSKTGEKRIFIGINDLKRIVGICENLYMTRLEDAILVHYGIQSDWTSALYIPVSNFDMKANQKTISPIDEALDWFLSSKN